MGDTAFDFCIAKHGVFAWGVFMYEQKETKTV